MNTPNPLHPQGAFLENRGRSQVRIAVFTILAIHVVLLGALLLQGCKRTAEPLPPLEQTNVPPMEPLPVMPLPPTQAVIMVPPTQAVVVPPIQQVAPVEPAPLAGTEHTVIKGDTFGKLARQYKTTIKAIAEANPGVDSARLKIGQKLAIPAAAPAAAAVPAATSAFVEEAKTYVVKSGDNLSKIARTHGVSVKQLRAANNLRTDQIKVGQKLKIPGKASAPVAPPAATEPAPLAPTLPPPVPVMPPPTNF